ncbi:MAG: hypothetical protein RTU92_06060 [Candidatus Thorarchaeota archaeon]
MSITSFVSVAESVFSLNGCALMDMIYRMDRYPPDIRENLRDPYVEFLHDRVRIDPGNGDLWYALGEHLKHLGMLKEAEIALLEALEVDKYMEFAWFLLAMIYEQTSRRPEADAAWDAFDVVQEEKALLRSAIQGPELAAEST